MTTKDNVQPPHGEWATVTELCEMYNLSRSTVHRWLKNSDDVRYFVKSNTMRVRLDDFDALINSFVEETLSKTRTSGGRNGLRK